MRLSSSKARYTVTAGLVLMLGTMAPTGFALADEDPVVQEADYTSLIQTEKDDAEAYRVNAESIDNTELGVADDEALAQDEPTEAQDVQAPVEPDSPGSGTPVAIEADDSDKLEDATAGIPPTDGAVTQADKPAQPPTSDVAVPATSAAPAAPAASAAPDVLATPVESIAPAGKAAQTAAHNVANAVVEELEELFNLVVGDTTTAYDSLAAAVAAAPTDGTLATINPLQAVAVNGFTTKAGQNIVLNMNRMRVNLSNVATVVAGSTVTIGGSGMLGTSNNDALVKLIDNFGTVIVNGAQLLGTLTGKAGSTTNVLSGVQYLNLIGESGSAVTVSGNTSSPRFTAGYGAITAKSGSDFTFTGGSVRTELVVEDGANIQISGGSFLTPVKAAWCAEGYAPSRGPLTGTTPYSLVKRADAWAKVTDANGNEYFYTQYLVGTALNNMQGGETLTLLEDHAAKSLNIQRANTAPVTIDLNGFSYKAATVWYGDVTLINGTILGDIDLYPQVQNSGKVSNLTIGKGCVVQDGIVLWPEYDNQTGTGYDTTLTVYGTVNNRIFVSGNLHEGNATINIKDGAKVTGGTAGIAVNGFATVNVESGAAVSGDTGIEVRAGNLNVTGGTITGTGSFAISPNDSGTTSSGCGIAVSQHTTNLPIRVSISGGTMSGDYALYEKDTEQDAHDNVSITVSGGSFAGNVDGIKAEDAGVLDAQVAGGKFSTYPNEAHIKDGYVVVPSGDEALPYTLGFAIDKPAQPTTSFVFDGTVHTLFDDERIVVSGGSATDAGTYTATVTPADGYAWKNAPLSGNADQDARAAAEPLTFVWSIEKASLADAAFAAIADQTIDADGYATPSVTGTFLGTALVRDKDYTVTYLNNDKVGTATARIRGLGNFSGEATIEFKILAGTISQDAYATVSAPVDDATLNTDLTSMEGVFTDDERDQIETRGSSARIWLKVSDVQEEVDEQTKSAVAQQVGDEAKVIYLDVSLFKRVGNNAATAVTKTSDKVSITLALPSDLLPKAEDERAYVVVRVHNGEVDILDAAFDGERGTLTFETDRFSTYGIAYTGAKHFGPVTSIDGVAASAAAYVPKHLAIPVTGALPATGSLPATGDADVAAALRFLAVTGAFSAALGAVRRRAMR